MLTISCQKEKELLTETISFSQNNIEDSLIGISSLGYDSIDYVIIPYPKLNKYDIKQVTICNKYVALIEGNSNSILIYSSTGKYISSIKNKNNSTIGNIWFNQDESSIFVFFSLPGLINEYDLPTLSLLKTTIVKYNPIKAVSTNSDNFILYHPIPRLRKLPTLVSKDEKKEISILKQNRIKLRQRKNLIPYHILSINGHSVYFWDSFTNAIYSINEDNSCQLKYKFQTDDDWLDYGSIYTMNELGNSLQIKTAVTNIWINNKYICFQLVSRGKINYLTYSINNRKLIPMRIVSCYNKPGWADDINDGLPFLPKGTSISGNFFTFEESSEYYNINLNSLNFKESLRKRIQDCSSGLIIRILKTK